MSKYIKNTDKSIQAIRFFVQLIFSLLWIWLGIEFSSFIKYLETGGIAGYFYRHPGIEGFLHISALMSVYYFLQTGLVHSIHPAGFFIFWAIVGVPFVFGKAFCGWMCPIGFISELIGDFGERIWRKLLKKRVKLHRYIDYPLRSFKYLLLAFFAYAVFSMSTTFLHIFLDGSYNIAADIKMWYFFVKVYIQT